MNGLTLGRVQEDIAEPRTQMNIGSPARRGPRELWHPHSEQRQWERGLYLLGGSQLPLQMFYLLLCLPYAPQGIFVCNLLALPSISFLQFPDAAPQFINL